MTLQSIPINLKLKIEQSSLTLLCQSSPSAHPAMLMSI